MTSSYKTDEAPAVEHTELPAVRRRRGQRALVERVTSGVPAAVLVGVITCLVVFKLRTIPVVSDPWNYVLAGQTFPQITWNLVGLTRYGVILPLVPVSRLFHDSELTYYLTPVLASGLLAASVHWLTARFFGRIAALAAVVLLVANSAVLLTATRLYPDIFSASFTCLAVALAVASRDRWGRDLRVGPPLLVLLALTGLAVGVSWTMRETSVFTWPAVAAVLLWRGGPPLKALLATAGSAFLVLVLEMLVSYLAFGDAFTRFKALTHLGPSGNVNPYDLPYFGHPRVWYVGALPRSMRLFEDGNWMLAMMALAVVGGIVFVRKVGLFAGWFLSTTFFFVFFGGVLHPASPFIRIDVPRYWVVFLPPMIIAAVGTVTLLCRWAVRFLPRLAASGATVPRAAVAAVVAVLLVGGPVLASAATVRATPAYVVSNGAVMAQFRTWLHDHDKQVSRIHTDFASARQLGPYRFSFSGHRLAHAKIIPFSNAAPPRTGDYVVLFSANDETCAFCRDYESAWLSQHPRYTARWPEVWHSTRRTFVVYRVP